MEDGLGLGTLPQVIPVIDVVLAPGLADVGALQPVHLSLPHGAKPGPLRQVGQLFQGGAGRQSEVVHETRGQLLRVQGLPVRVVIEQGAAEAAQGLGHHSNSLLPVNFSYISTMNRLALMVMGPSGRVPTRKAGSSSTNR